MDKSSNFKLCKDRAGRTYSNLSGSWARVYDKTGESFVEFETDGNVVWMYPIFSDFIPEQPKSISAYIAIHNICMTLSLILCLIIVPIVLWICLK